VCPRSAAPAGRGRRCDLPAAVGRKLHFAEQKTVAARIKFHGFNFGVTALGRIAVEGDDKFGIGAKQDGARIGRAGALEAAAGKHERVVRAQIRRQCLDERFGRADPLGLDQRPHRLEPKIRRPGCGANREP